MVDRAESTVTWLPAFCKAAYTPPDVTGLELPDVGAVSKVSVSCLLARAACTPPDVTGLLLDAVGVVSKVSVSCLFCSAE